MGNKSDGANLSLGPIRMCCACRKHKEKDMLVRFVVKDENVVIDSSYKHSGRGAYICKNIKCFEKAKKEKSLNKAFKMNIPEENYNSFMNYMLGSAGNE